MAKRADLSKEYGEIHHPLFEVFASRLASLMEDLLTNARIPFSQIEYRAKTVESFLEKINRKHYKDPISEMKDLAGIRVITYYHDDVQRVADLLHSEFDVDPEHSTDKATELAVDEFGYRSFHLICRLNDRRQSLTEWSRFATFPVEIQVRSVLQHAWAAISHKIDYKSAAEAPR